MTFKRFLLQSAKAKKNNSGEQHDDRSGCSLFYIEEKADDSHIEQDDFKNRRTERECGMRNGRNERSE